MEKFKKQIAGLLIIILLFLLGIYLNRFTLSTFSSHNHPAASRINKADQNTLVTSLNATPSNSSSQSFTVVYK
jgi:hypothetical protein